MKLRYPNITGPTERECIEQIKRYLFQLVDEMQFSGNGAQPTSGAVSTSVSNANTRELFSVLKSLIIKSDEILNAYSGKLAETFVLKSELETLEELLDSLSDLIAELDDTLTETACADFVIEQGVGNGWTYKKRKNGTYEMYGIFEVTPSASDINNTLYLTNDIQVPTPFPIQNDAVITGTVTGSGWLTNCKCADSNAISIKVMSDEPFSLTDTITLRLQAVGTYNQTETEV